MPDDNNDTQKAAVAFLAGISLTGSAPSISRTPKQRTPKNQIKELNTNETKRFIQRKKIHVSSVNTLPNQDNKYDNKLSRSTIGISRKSSNLQKSTNEQQKKHTLNKFLKGPSSSKLFFTVINGGTPYAVSSLISIGDASEKKKRQRSDTNSSHQLKTHAHQSKDVGVSLEVLLRKEEEPYNPTFLDDPTLTTGRHSTVMHLSGMRITILPYVRKKTLKEDLNEKFEQIHPDIKIKLTSLRSVKKKILQSGLDYDLDIGTIAHSYIYFEKLILNGYVTMENRKQIGAVCLLLAAKFYHYSTSKTFISGLVSVIEKHLTKQEFMSLEVPVFIQLNFKLIVDPKDVKPHYSILLQRLQRTTDAVIGRYRGILNYPEVL